MNNCFINVLILFSLSLTTIYSQSELSELRSRITIFDLIFNNWITTSIASIGILSDYFLGRIPYPNERNTTRLFQFIDQNTDERMDIKEFQSYLVKLFHAQDVLSFEFGRKVTPLEITNHFTLWGPQTQNMRWNCFLDNFDKNNDLNIDFNEFESIKRRKFDAFNCLICVKYQNHCIDFNEIYFTKL